MRPRRRQRQMGRALLAAVLLTAVLLAPPLSARSLRFRVSGERRLAEIARKVYGRSSAAAILATANRLPVDAKLADGDSLRVPVCLRTSSKRTQSFSRLARLHLRRKSRASLLAFVNRLDPDKPVAAGTSLVIPALLWHEVRRGENMISLSRSYYRNRDGRWLLRKVNGNRPSNKLEVGEKILVPIFADYALEQKVQQRIDAARPPDPALSISEPRATDQPGDSDSSAPDPSPSPASVGDSTPGAPPPPAPAPTTQVDMTQAYRRALRSPLIEQGVAFYRRGDFLACVAYFRRALLEPGLAPGRRVAAQVWLAGCYVGADETERAEEAMLGALRAAPRLELDRAATSPKILQVFERARGRLTSP